MAAEAVPVGSAAVSSVVSPRPSVREFLSNVTVSGAGLTVILVVAVFPLKVFTVITSDPTFLPLIIPAGET